MSIKQVLDPYKTIGCFIHGPSSISQTQPFSFAVGCHNSFKIYNEELAIKMVSGCFNSPVRALHIHNEFSYVVIGTEIIKIRYQHVVRKWQLPISPTKGKNIEQIGLLVFDGVIILGVGTNIYIVPEPKIQKEEEAIETINIGISIISIIHPVTYINKVIAYSSEQIILLNPITQKILYNYKTFTQTALEGNKKIILVSTTPIVDIVAVCLDNGEIIILNLRTSKLVFTIKQKRQATAIAFSNTENYMGTADESGNIILWDLEKKSIIYRLESSFDQPIDLLFFVPGFPLLTAGSSKSNSIRQFRINLDDSKTLSLFRERSGCSPLSPITRIECHNNKEITLSTENNTVFSSLYSHTNMYTLPKTLYSSLPYHVVARNFNLELYRERTIIGKINLHENIELASISMSKKFIIAATKSRILKIAIPSGSNPSTHLHISCEYKICEVSELSVCREKYIYALCSQSIYVYNFNLPTLVASINSGENCCNFATNLSQSMIAMENRTKGELEVWDMTAITVSRQFKLFPEKLSTKLAFTPDNRYLLSSHMDKSISIWSMVQGCLYKEIHLEGLIKDMIFTPDGGYLLTIFENAKEIHIWHNYIGKIATTQIENQFYQFQTSLNQLHHDYRATLTTQSESVEQIVQSNNEFDELLDSIPNAEDANKDMYDFKQVGKWMPLVYYDEIKNRNTVTTNTETALPFFLDFKNITEQQEKYNKEILEERKNSLKNQNEKIDENLKNIKNSITLIPESTSDDYVKTWETLTSISVAEVDYHLRSYLLSPEKYVNLLKMFNYLIENNLCNNMMQLNIIIARTLELLGSSVCGEDGKETAEILLNNIRGKIEEAEDTVGRCVGIATFGG